MPLAGRKVLLVEDEALVGLDLMECLHRTNCEVVGPLLTLSDAIEAIKRHRPDCAVLDIKVGGEHTTLIADELAARTIPFVWVSGYEREMLPVHYRDRPFVAKPFLHDALLNALLNALES